MTPTAPRRMKPIEFRCWREYLGLPIDWVAANLSINIRVLQYWENNTKPMPAFISDMMRQWVTEAEMVVGKLTLAHNTAARPIEATHDEWINGWPPSWNRAIAARVAERTKLPITPKANQDTNAQS